MKLPEIQFEDWWDKNGPPAELPATIGDKFKIIAKSAFFSGMQAGLLAAEEKFDERFPPLTHKK